MILLGLLALPFVIISNGVVASRLWTYFVCPFGAPPVSVARAVGLSALSAVIVGPGGGGGDLTEARIIAIMTFPWFVLLIGEIAHTWDNRR